MSPPRSSQGGHWYCTDGRPVHTLALAHGGQRRTTLQDARQLGLYPSVTGILGVIAKPGLENWKNKQIASAAARLNRNPGECNDEFADRIIEAGSDVSGAARDLGSNIHRALEQFWLNQAPIPMDLQPYCLPAISAIQSFIAEVFFVEQILVNRQHGFAGTIDLAVRTRRGNLAALDYKVRKTNQGEPVRWYDEHVQQVAAYAATAFGEDKLPTVHGANVLISSTQPGRVEIKHYAPAELVKAFETFALVCELWRRVNNYDPRRHPGNQQ